MANESLLATMTGEHFQPVRLHYKILNRSKLLRTFKALRCLDHDPRLRRWVWLYADEARKLRFKQSYAQISQEAHPIVIGSFYVRTPELLLLDLRSCERALVAIPFFDAQLPRGLVELGDAEVVNSLFPATRANLTLAPETFFDSPSGGGTAIDHTELLQQIAAQTAAAPDLDAKLDTALAGLRSRARKPRPAIERFPTHFVEDGIAGFQLSIQLRQIIALNHWLGHTDYTMDDAIQAVKDRF